ncbi:hypothetical protein HRG_005334 [Hirsutella rhossiliensis]|uniref:Uncharacterized protein n=1 Tax=Hirsutella rhossiliensis TaxID=111463 RepID=A0A9P8SI47_9HYPO|nr:uncharacterized protein HRG_05334 [Hirsutella rhossiliensis]KAH0962824.1 hypothetical protein HRG_05334 [Hirsutella rhossiliensis]
MDDGGFSAFAQFPAEVRQLVWRYALAQSWSFSRLKRVNGGGLGLVGKLHRSVGQACREARGVMQATHELINGLGYVDFARHLFFFRDAKADRGVMQQAANGCDLLRRIRHVVLGPRDWPRLWHSLETMGSRCAELRALVVVAPWFDPAAILEAHGGSPEAAFEALDVAPYEAWGPLFRTTPLEIAPGIAALLAAVEHGGASNAERLSQYRERLDRAVQLIPSNVDELDNAYGRTRVALHKVEQAIVGFAGATPSLYLRTREELMSCPETRG